LIFETFKTGDSMSNKFLTLLLMLSITFTNILPAAKEEIKEEVKKRDVSTDKEQDANRLFDLISRSEGTIDNALRTAIFDGEVDDAEFLIKHGANPHTTIKIIGLNYPATLADYAKNLNHNKAEINALLKKYGIKYGLEWNDVSSIKF
jgi:hypothetical protein